MSRDDLYPSDSRLQLMQRGVNQLETWLNDLLKMGLLDYDFSTRSLNEISSRMVDAKLGGIARRIRMLSEMEKSDVAWAESIAHELTSLSLFARCFKRLDSLGPAMQQTVLA